MHRLSLIALICLAGCGDHSPKPAVDTATNTIESRQRADGSRAVTFITPFFYGDKVQFDSVNGQGIGFIDGIVLARDGSVYYEVQDAEKKLEDGQYVIYAGIYPDEITLIERVTKNAEPGAAPNDGPEAPFGNSSVTEGRHR